MRGKPVGSSPPSGGVFTAFFSPPPSESAELRGSCEGSAQGSTTRCYSTRTPRPRKRGGDAFSHTGGMLFSRVFLCFSFAFCFFSSVPSSTSWVSASSRPGCVCVCVLFTAEAFDHLTCLLSSQFTHLFVSVS